MKRLLGWLSALALVFNLSVAQAAEAPLTSLGLDIVGVGLQAYPEYQAVPKGIPTQVVTGIDAQGFDPAAIISQLPKDYRVKAELSGPAFPTPITLETRPGQPFDIPTLALYGKHTLNNIRLVDSASTTLFGAVPQAVVIESINDPLITEVKTRQLSLEEIEERGVVFDESNFTAYEFTAAIATESGQVPLTLPVLIPDSTKEVLKQNVTVGLPPPPPLKEIPQVQVPNLQVQGFKMAVVDEIEGIDPIELPSIPGIVVIPGNIGFLHQYFSAMAIVTNGAPEQSDLVIRDVKARIVLPEGEDLTAGTDADPGDDPLRIAKGAEGFFPRELPVMHAGADGRYGTADDESRLAPAETAQADFTIEGLREGTHKLDFEITATLVGLPVGPVQLKGHATGAVLVRNPDFAVTMSHPATVRAGEKYDLFVTVSNTAKSIANLVSVHLDPRALSGAAFVEGEEPDKEIETIPPGSSGTVHYRLVSQKTGAVTASVFESDDVKGRFNLRTGVGENGIPLSPDSLILPYTGGLPPDLVTSAMGLLGQAWSVATAPAGALPADISRISKQTVSQRAFDLSEAGVRILIGDTSVKAIEDFTFDLIGSDKADRPFDELRRRSTPGLELNRALGVLFSAQIESSGLFDFQSAFADKVSYRPGHISVITSEAPLRVRLADAAGNYAGGLGEGEDLRDLPHGDQVILSEADGARSTLTLATTLDSPSYRLDMLAEDDALFDLAVVLPDAVGTLRQVRFAGISLSAGARATATLVPGSDAEFVLNVDSDGDGEVDRTISRTGEMAIPDRPPEVVAATQIVPGFGPGGDKHGRNVAVLFSETVTAESAKNSLNYLVDENEVRIASLQPGSRMAFLLLRDGIGPFFERHLTVDGLVDSVGNAMTAAVTLPVRVTAQGPAAVVDGVVRESDGTPVPGATIRLLQMIWKDDGIFLEPVYVIFSEKQAAEDGSYHFDYVLQNDDPRSPFRIEVLHPETEEEGRISTGVNYHGERLNLDLFMKARGSISGTVRDASGAPTSGAAVQVTTLNDGRTIGTTTDATGRFAFSGVSVGAYKLKAVSTALYAEGQDMGVLPEEGGAVSHDLTLYPVSGLPRGEVSGKVLGADGIPRSGMIAIVNAYRYRDWMRTREDGSFSFAGVPAGAVSVEGWDEGTGERSEVKGSLSADETAVFNVILKGTGTVQGEVQCGDGKSPEGLYLMATFGGDNKRLVQADAQGAYRFENLPVGNVKIDVHDPQSGNRIVASVQVDILAAGEVVNVPIYVPDTALATGTITGTVYRRDGSVWANAPIRLLLDSWTYRPFSADAEGRYTLPDLPLKTYRIVVLEGNEVINATASLWYGTQVKTLDLRPAGIGTVTGTTWDDAERTLPTGADVRLYSTKPDQIGWLVYDTKRPTTIKSDPQTGRFTFSGVHAGAFTVETSNIFRPIPVRASGTIGADGETVDVQLALKGEVKEDGTVEEINAMGSVSGRILLPDGTPAGEGVRVSIYIAGADVTVTTDGEGSFQSSPVIPAGNHRVLVYDPITTLSAELFVNIPSGGDVAVSPRLLGRGELTIKVLNADGTPAAGAAVSVSGSAYPNDAAAGETGEDGTVFFANLTEGSYAISATGSFGRGGRSEAVIASDGDRAEAEVTLAPSGIVKGTFFKADGSTPVEGGQVKLLKNGRVIAYTSSSADPASPGSFSFEHVPLGDFALEGYDPVTERSGRGGGRLGSDGATVETNVVVTPQGIVKGVVLNYSGTSPIDRSAVEIQATGYNYSTTTGPDGAFVFAGVPSGRFTLRTVDPVSGLTGQTSGSIGYEGETVEAELRIAPTGRIAGRVLMPDGVTPCTDGSVSFGGSIRQIDPVDGSFSFDHLAVGSSYTLTAVENGSHRAGRIIVSLTQDGETAPGEIVLRGVGEVTGTVFDTDGVTPLLGATVSIEAHGTVSAGYTVYTDAEGRYRFADVPAGAFTLRIRHDQRVTAGAASGYLESEGEIVSVDMVIGPVASVTGMVVGEDGATFAAGGGVRFTGCGRTFTTVIGADGIFAIENIPVPCDFSLHMEDASETGIADVTGSLTVNGETLDIGTVVLDEQPISVLQVEPASGSVNVPVDTAIKILFSEPARSDTVNSATVKLLRGSSQVSGSLMLDGDQAGVTFTPNAPLQGFALYTVVVTMDLRDLVGRPMARNYTATFTTIDNIPPAVVSVSPANGQIQVALDGVVRITFSEAIDASRTSGVKLMLGGAGVAGRLDLIQGGTVAVITPEMPMSANRTYSVSVSGVYDTVGNAMAGSQLTTFNTIDTLVPTVTSLIIPEGARLIEGLSTTVTAQVPDSDAALVDFFVDDQFAGTDNSVPFTFSLNLSKPGELRVKAIPQDKVGNRGAALSRTLQVAADQPPTVAITVPAQEASVETGSAVTISVQAGDDIGVHDVTLTASGSAAFTQTLTGSGASFSGEFTLNVPSGAAPGSEITLRVVATDSKGQQSLADVRTLTVRDSLPPTIDLSSSGETVRFKPGETGIVHITASDNIGVTGIACTAKGAAIGSDTLAIDPAESEASQDFAFNVAPDAAPQALMTINCSAGDASGNEAFGSISLYVADVVPPRVQITSIADGATDVPTLSTFSVTFDEPLAAATINGASVLLTTGEGTQSIAGTVSLSADVRTVTFAPAASLERGMQYQLSLGTGITDEAGNNLAAAFVLRFTADIRPPAIKTLSPAADSQNVPVGSTVAVTFTEPIDSASVTQDTLTLASSFGPVPGNISVSADQTTIILKPLGQLSFNREYSVTLKAGVQDVSGNAVTSDYYFTFKTQAPDSDLVGLWTMDEDWSDSSGNGNDLVPVNGATFDQDSVTGSYAGIFSGNNAYARRSSGNNLPLRNDPRTYMAWIKPFSFPDQTYNGIFAYGQIKCTGYGSLLSIKADGKLSMAFWCNDAYQLEGPAVPLNEWTHVAFTYDGNLGIQFYVNGKMVQGRQIAQPPNTLDGPIRIGSTDDPGRVFHGLIDEVAVYRRDLSSEDIFEVYNAGLTGDRIPPAAPVVNPVPESIYSNILVLSGTKDSEASIRINGKQEVSHDLSTTWQVLSSLQPGQNILSITSKDISGNESEPVTLSVDVLPANQRDPDIVGLWHMDGNWQDYSGNGNHGTANNGALFNKDGINGGESGSFDGTDDYILIANQVPPSLQIQNEISLEAWIYLTQYPIDDLGLIVGSQYDVNKVGASIFIDGRTNPDGQSAPPGHVHFQLGDGSWHTTNTQTKVPLNEWVHIVATRKANEEAKIYYNGVLQPSTSVPWSGSISYSGAWFAIGRQKDLNRNYKGLIDEVTVYKRALTEEEIQNKFTAKPGISFASPGQIQHFWPGDTAMATVIAESSSGLASLTCIASEAASGISAIPFHPPRAQWTEDFSFKIATDANPSSLFVITCSAIDDLGKVTTSKIQLTVADEDPPQVVAVTPAAGEMKVSTKTRIIFKFDEPVEPSSLEFGRIVLNSPQGTIPGLMSLSQDYLSVTFTPSHALSYDTDYTVILEPAITDFAGNQVVSDYRFSFHTQVLSYIDCADIKSNNPSASPGSYVIDPDGSGGNAPITAYCSMTSAGSAWTFYFVNGGKTTRYQTDNDSCKDVGLRIFAPRNRDDYEAGRQYLSSIGRTDSFGPLGVYYPYNGPGCCTNWATYTPMNSYWAGKNKGWKSTAGDTWWISDMTHVSEPNGDYSANAWLGLWFDGSGNVRWYNDYWGNYAYNTYLCSAYPHEVQPPMVNPVASPTSDLTILLSGSKPANTAIAINDSIIVPLDGLPTWQVPFTLSVGENTLSIRSQDAQGYTSLPVTISVFFSETSLNP